MPACQRRDCPHTTDENENYCDDRCRKIHRVQLLIATARSPEAGKEATAAAKLALEHMRKLDLVFWTEDERLRSSYDVSVSRYWSAPEGERAERAERILAATKDAHVLPLAQAAEWTVSGRKRPPPPAQEPSTPSRGRGGGFFTFDTVVAVAMGGLAALAANTEVEPGRSVADVAREVVGSGRAIRASLRDLMKEIRGEDAPKRKRRVPSKSKTTKKPGAKKKRAR